MSNEWISVKDRLPENCAFVLAFSPYEDPVVAQWLSDRQAFKPASWFINGRDYDVDLLPIDPKRALYDIITHWMPLPPPPSTEKKGD